MIERNTGVSSAASIVFRIGINLGDIIIDGDDIFGDGVNIAARLQASALPVIQHISPVAVGNFFFDNFLDFLTRVETAIIVASGLYIGRSQSTAKPKT